MIIYNKHLSIILLFLCSIFLPLYAAEQNPNLLAMDGKKIVTAAGVRMRTAIQLNATVIDKLALGTIVRATKRTRKKVRTGSVVGHWYYVTYSNKEGTKKGWVFGSLLRDFKADKAESIHWKLIQERRAKKKASFADDAQLYAYIKRTIPTIKTTNIRANLELEALLTLQQAADKIPYHQYKIPPYALFLAKHKKILFYGEIQGRYLVSNNAYWKLAGRYATTTSGDKLAWYAAIAPTAGECEGDVECMFGRMMLQEGAYLQRYPNGTYSDKALKEITEILDYILKTLKENQKEYSYIRFRNLKKDHRRLMKALNEGNSVPIRRKKVLKQLKQLPTLIKH